MLKLAAMLGLSLGSLAVWAQAVDEATVTLYVDENVTYDSNIFRVERETALIPRQGDTRSSTGAGLEFALPVSRQKLLGAVHVASDRYARFEELDHGEHDARLVWEWQGGDIWSGQLGALSSRRLASFSSFASRLPDLLSQRSGFVAAGAELTATWHLRLDAASRTLRHDTRTMDDVDGHQAGIGVDYMSRAGNSIGPFARQLSASYPEDSGAHGFHQRSAGLRLVYLPGDKSRIEGRVERARRDFSAGQFGDATRTIVLLEGRWQATEKLQWIGEVRRDFGAAEDITTHQVFIIGAGLRLRLAASEKIDLSASVASDRREYPDEPLGRHDRLGVLGVALAYRPAAWAILGISLQREQRSSDLAMAGYGANVISLSARLSL